MIEHAIEAAYLAASAAFILALRWLNHPSTARRGVLVGAVGMALAIAGTLLHPRIVDYRGIAAAVVVGTLVGVPLSWVPLTAVPQRTALSHAFGGLAAGLVGTAEYSIWLRHPAELTPFRISAVTVEIMLGFLTFTGSLMAAGKLQEIVPTRPITYRGQNLVNLAMLAAAIACGVLLVRRPDEWRYLAAVIGLALVFGVSLILPIGGADMPTVISLLNSYAGLAAVAMGFVLENKLLITAGALDGSSGFILSLIMCRAMNRSFANVLFGAFGKVRPQAAVVDRSYKSLTPEDAAQMLAAANLVVVVPGYGMAVSQAQHRVRELYELLSRRGVDVRFAIHPVAGRMPGHMNVLLAEADIPYDRLVEMDEINPEMPQADVALVVGANDVVNPAARSDPNSPIYGMPIIDADKARICLAIKRSMNPGFAGIENELYFRENTYMVFGDAKAVIAAIADALKRAA
ncbi:MAG TPA: NAD(P)(+) transhydrogenase (Re/Si-specific) subunit beta [Vicinamibacterales bacterium]|nr:NAD(P)(+) transhydrogenase (Re/Si-specific) subunit beta [Vicinamibacterales bacterium]